MNEPSSPQKIQRFVPPQWLEEISVQETTDYTHHQYQAVEPLSRDQLSLVEDNELAQHHDSRAADETAYLQAQINAKRADKPLEYVSDKPDSVGHTAYLQHQIDLRRKK